MIDSPYLAKPGKKINLADYDTADTGRFKDKAEAVKVVAHDLKTLKSQQNVLYAQAKHSVLIVLQAMDTGGKDGAIDHVFSGVNPQGCDVTSFKQPSALEAKHDFLWRIHAAAPPRGMIKIFNRSHYEDVLVVRVHDLVPESVWSRRYEQINQFEKLLAEEGTTIIKFFLHISKQEQKKRIQRRLDDHNRTWKFDPNDLVERKKWAEYQEAYTDAIRKCSTAHAPWYVVPSDHKWFRNWVISDTIVRTLDRLKMKFPKPAENLDGVKVD